MRPEPLKTIRCAIYTRKSTEEGLEQDFNSLDAQREASLAYIESQRHEGWRALPTLYDDGGFSGGTMDRPALKQLLKDIGAGQIDIVVVYKVDRLTRSLSDFAKIVEIFDRHKVSFVSITQQFNTTSSMGRLTLNILLSFAQFEREVTGERIRDKIAASRRKGMWMGGLVPLGYEAKEKKLIEEKTSADLVRRIFESYLALGCVARLKAELDGDGTITPRRKTPAGREIGGRPFSRGALYKILNNRIYIGEAVHKGKIYPGEHKGIVPKELWDRVQGKLSGNAATLKQIGKVKGSSLLAGLLLDDRGNKLSPAHAGKAGRCYRYYVSQAVLQNRPEEKGSVTRVPAHDLEKLVTERIASFLGSPTTIGEKVFMSGDDATSQKTMLDAAERVSSSWSGLDEGTRPRLVRALMLRAIVSSRSLIVILSRTALRRMLLEPDGADDPEARMINTDPSDELSLDVPTAFRTGSKEIRMVIPAKNGERYDPSLVRALARAYAWKERLLGDEEVSIRSIAAEERITESYVGRILRLAFLAPDIIEAILDSRQPPGLNLDLLRARFSTEWFRQRRELSAGASG